MSTRTTSASVADTASLPCPTLLAQLAVAARTLVVLTLVTGVGYPLVVAAVAGTAFGNAAHGSLLKEGGRTVGSRHIGQPFDEPRYFWGRASATTPWPNNAQASGGSNLGPTNPELTKAAGARIEALRVADPGNAQPIPVDLVTASASGLDPHITPAAAFYQVPRVAQARGMEEARVRALVMEASEGRELGVLGEPRVNVLLLNLALDRRK